MGEKSVILAVALLIFGGLSGAVFAAEYPSKPMELVCCFAAGSDADIIGRVVAEVGSKHFGQSIVVLNKAGGAGAIGVADVISSKPDGYKALWHGHAYFATTYRTQKIPFNPNDLIPLACFYEMKQGLSVRGDSPFKTFDDLVAYGKKHPGDVKWSHSGRGVTLHMSAMLAFRKAGVNAIDVPYKGSSEAAVALLGGHVEAASLPIGVVADQVKAGKVRFLMVYTDKRYEDHPNVPTVGELGFPDAAMPSLWAVFIRKDTPEPIKKVLTDLTKKMFDDPDLKKGVEKLGGQPRYGGADFTRAAIKKQEEIGIPALRELGMLVEK